MLDTKELRQNLPEVEKKLKSRGYEFDRMAFDAMETERKDLQVSVESLQNKRKVGSKSIGQAKAKGEDTQVLMADVEKVNVELAGAEVRLQDLQAQLAKFTQDIPNIPDNSVPIGKSEAENIQVSCWGKPKEFDFEVADHVKLGESLAAMDYEVAAKLTGARFCVLSGDLAKLHRALAQFMLDTHLEKHGYREVNVPFIVHESSLKGTGQLPKFSEDLFHLEGDRDWYLIPTAEVPLTNLVRDQIIEGSDLPLKWVAHTPCFRSEAGAYGRDTRGLIRQHQFEKVEMVNVVRPEASMQALESLVSDAEHILQLLELPYRKMLLCTGDMGFSATKTYDLEVWLPGQDAYREISSCSNCGDFQARRMQARYRVKGQKKPQLVHTLNGSGLAVGRTLIAVMENYQTADGKIEVPSALVPYMKGQDILG